MWSSPAIGRILLWTLAAGLGLVLSPPAYLEVLDAFSQFCQDGSLLLLR
jgi:hypothetical protein